MKFKLLILFLFSLATNTFAQMEEAVAPAQQENQTKTSVMVIPFVKEAEDMRTIVESDYSGHLRLALAGVRDALQQKGMESIDFRAFVKQHNNQSFFTSDQQSSLKQKVIEFSAVDIYVETEVQIIETPKGNSVTVILTAFDAFTGLSLVNKLGSSPKFYSNNFEKLTEKALAKVLDDFSIELQSVIIDIAKNGKAIAVDIGVSKNSNIDFDSEFGDEQELLSDLIENWMEENAHQSHFHIQGITATKMIFDEVKIPASDPVSKKAYTSSKFAAQLRKYLTNLGLEVTRDVQGGKVFITISKE